MLFARVLTERVIGLAIAVHRVARLGALESIYEGCLRHELEQACVAFERQGRVTVTYKGARFDEGCRADILVDEPLIVEIKAVANIVPAHDAQVLTSSA